MDPPHGSQNPHRRCGRTHENPQPMASHQTPPENRPTQTPDSGNHYRSDRCPGCGTRWTGIATCHCTHCHRTFTDMTAFAKHRAGSHTNGTRHCINPPGYPRWDGTA